MTNYDDAVAYAIEHPEEGATDIARRFGVQRNGLIAAAGRQGRLFATSRRGRPRAHVVLRQRVGRLTVVADSGSMIEVECDCGQRRWMFPSVLLAHGATRRLRCGRGCSLGPTPIERIRIDRQWVRRRPKTVLDRAPTDQARAFLLAISDGARDRGIAVSITLDDIIRIRVGKPCEYCGGTLGTSTCIDRIDNSLGYHPDNVAACCAHCNDAKGHLLSGDEFKAAMAIRLARTGAGKAWEGVTMRSRTPRKRRK